MHHRGCTRARAINLHFIIFYDAFNNDAVPSDDLGGKAGKRGERDFIDRVLYDVGPYPAISFLLIHPVSQSPSLPIPPSIFQNEPLSGPWSQKDVNSWAIFRSVRLFVAFDEYRASIASRSAPSFDKFRCKTCDSDYNHNVIESSSLSSRT
jgi:hypothetical protein